MARETDDLAAQLSAAIADDLGKWSKTFIIN